MGNLAFTEIVLIIAYLLLLVGALSAIVYFGVKVLALKSMTGTTVDSVQDQYIRASTEDRNKTISQLQGEVGYGRLTLTEFEDRLQRAQSAETVGELYRLVKDLPFNK